MNRLNRQTYEFVKAEIQSRNLTPHICEVGVGHPENSIGIRLAEHWGTGSLTLVDPNPNVQPQIEEAIHKDLKGSAVETIFHKAAVLLGPKPPSGTVDLLVPTVAPSHFKQEMAHISGPDRPGPALHPEQTFESVPVPCMTWDEIDTGQFEVLLLDMEGSEWAVISQLVSRPLVITIEMEWNGKPKRGSWQNPHQKEIHLKLLDLGYACVHRGNGDWFYVRKS